MPIRDIYSRRKKRENQTEPDIYRYDRIPDTLRTQIRIILDSSIGPFYVPKGYGMQSTPSHNNAAWHYIRDLLCREMGLLSLANDSNPKNDCIGFIHREEKIDSLLDLVEVAFSYINTDLNPLPKYELNRLGITQSPIDAIEELNFRFREAAVGYQFVENQIIRIDSELLHSEVVVPALNLLRDPRFSGPQDEFLSAHAHYRAREYKDCVADALNAFESTMKAICEIKGWEYDKGATANGLLKVLRTNGLLPDYLDKSFDQLAATLSSGLPKVRNEEGGHGQGAQPKTTPAYVAAYALHLAAAKIVLLVEALRDNT